MAACSQRDWQSNRGSTGLNIGQKVRLEHLTKGQRAATWSCNCHRPHRIEVAAAASATNVAAAASAAAPVSAPAAAAVAAPAAPPAEAPGVRHAKGLDVRLRKSSEC